MIHDKIHTLLKFKSPPRGSLDGRPVAALYKMAECRKRVFVFWNMRSVLRLRAFSVHSYANKKKMHLVTNAFCVGFASFVKLVEWVKGKAWGEGTHHCCCDRH
ncbi:hypothetical protein AVEN_155599-1 [Araneus ventricosus]|uniref:Uncharacterized protein n=1 Tax=Araneus ventricosus TaxID=182803 RepID=A0A4Y2A7C6_ARAVE|nr:hypothetical protein AVEN_155599-1 [Araneus ventricosus]